MLLWAMGTLCLVASIGADNAPAQTCMTNLTSGTFQFSSETRANTAHALYTAGWCAGNNDKNKWIEVTFNGGIGLKSVTVGSLDNQQNSYPKEVLVKYVPLGGTQLIDFPFESGSLVIKLDKFGAAISSFNSGIAISKLRFSLKDFENSPCMKVQLKGCTVKELCPVCVNGACVHENNCQCNQGYVGAGCDRKDCTPGPLGLGDGSLPSNQIQVSSEVSGHTKEEIRLDDKNQKIGWCPAVSDKSPWVTIHLDKPNNIRMLNFQFPKRQEGENKMYMSKFELLYIAPQDSTRMFRSFATDIPSMNETHYFQVTLVPGVVTDTLKIRASSFVERACFRLKLAGCDPENLCSPGWCQNNGTCIGQNTCKCEQGFFGERCDETKNQIKNIDAKFLQITQTVLITTTFNFTISGHVTLQTIGNFPVLILNGTNSFVQLKQSSAASLACLLDVNMCKSGFTFAIDVKFEKLLDNTYILSSGGNLVDHHGIALYYVQKHLIYIVTTSTFRWTLQVPYTPVLHQWQHFEITWNKGFGVELHVNGHLLGTFGRPDPITANQKVELCIGCSHSNVTVDISMQIKEFHTWTIDRTELVNAGLKPAPTVPGMTQASTTTPAATVAVTTTLLPTTPSKGYQEFNLTFTTIIGNLLITPTFNFTLHGKPVLDLEPNGHTAIVLDCQKHQYIELPDEGIPCLEDMAKCTKGFTFHLEIQFTSIDVTKKTYILSSGGDVETASGMAIYIHSEQLIFGVKQGHQHWTGTYNMTGIIQTKVWYKLEVSWSADKGISALIDGYEVIKSNDWSPTPLVAKTNPVLIGKTAGNDYTSCMKVRNLFTWTVHREVLVDSGILHKPMPTTPIPTTTLKPIPHFTWNFTQALGAHVTVHGATTITNSGISVTNSTQYIDFGITNLGCLINPGTCTDGLTIMFTIVFHRLDENTYLLTTGGQLPDGVGLAVLYRFNQVQFVLSTTTQSWFATCHRNQVQPNKPHTIMITWQVNLGLEVYINNVLVDSSNNSTSHTATTATTNTVHFGGQTVVTTTTNVKVKYVLQSITFWYAHLQILVDRGICQPPVKPTDTPTPKPPMTPKPTTKAPATPKPTTAATMFPKTSPQTCPVGCVSVASTTQPPPTTPTKKPATTPTKKPTPPVTPPAPDTATPSAKPTTERGPPNYVTNPSLSPIVGNDTKAYLACVFKVAGRDVVFTVSLLIDGKVVDQKTNPGYTGLVLFAVSKLDRNLMNKRIQCSVYARYVGGTHITVAFPSNIVIPKITVTPNRITVTEGKTSEFVTVKSTAPPQFYCCQGCKADCHVHIVGSFHYSRHQQKCNGNYIAQSLIVSKKPPHYNNPICGFPLTGTNWELNKIEVKATIDNRRDGDHTNTMEVIGHVYNQPSSAQITVKPSSSFTVSTVQVTAKDNDASATCKSVNDPHLRTFDGMNYNNMNEGVYMLYKHATLPFEVRALYHQCSKNHHHHHATCNCAVAVKSGDDVITVSGCQGTNSGHHGHGHGIGLIMQQLFGHKKDELARTPMTIQIYKNGDFTPGTIVRRFGCGQKYEIELPTGLIVTVQQSYKPFINIFLRGSSSDRGKSDGLCGNFDGNRRNDLKPSTSSFINRNKREYENFFYGVGVSSQQFLQTYCSCIKGKNKVCLSGIGAMRCVQTRNDITASLVKQAKRPILTRHKRQADIQATLPPTNIPTDETLKTDAEALQECTDHITNSPMTVSCTPILTSNTTEHIQNCVNDYMATGSFEWAKDALRDIAVECVDNINDFRAANESGNTNVTDEIDIPDAFLDTIDEILNKSCVDDCGSNGHCEEAVCVCDDGFSGVNCNISKETIPIISIVPFLCDMSQTSDCQGAMVFGEHFVDTPNLTCHYEFVEVGTDVTKTGETGQLKATFITINQVQCQLPQGRSAQLMISNDGVKPSPNMSMQVVFNSVCTECSVDGTTFKPSCIRKPNNCMIGGMCYGDDDKREGDPCQVCRPAANDTVWSKSYETMCKETVTEIVTVAQKMVTDDDDDNKNTTLALAIVCGVLAAVIVIGAICLIRKHGASKSTKGEFGSYDLSPSLHRNELKGASNATYSDDM